MRSLNRLQLAFGAAIITALFYEAVSEASLCEQQASSGQTQVGVN